MQNDVKIPPKYFLPRRLFKQLINFGTFLILPYLQNPISNSNNDVKVSTCTYTVHNLGSLILCTYMPNFK